MYEIFIGIMFGEFLKSHQGIIIVLYICMNVSTFACTYVISVLMKSTYRTYPCCVIQVQQVISLTPMAMKMTMMKHFMKMVLLLLVSMLLLKKVCWSVCLCVCACLCVYACTVCMYIHMLCIIMCMYCVCECVLCKYVCVDPHTILS